MHTLSTEHHSQINRADMALNIAEHLAVQWLYGQAVIVTDQPQAMPRDIKKAWGKVGRHSWLCSFAAAPPGDDEYAQVLFATPAECMQYPPNCTTMYITTRVDHADLHFMTSWMPRYGLVVTYPGVIT